MASFTGRSQHGVVSVSSPYTFLPRLLHSLHPCASTCGPANPTRLFAAGFGLKIREHELWGFFSQYGAVREVKIVVNRHGKSKGHGFVTFANGGDARKVLLLGRAGRIFFRGRKLRIRQAVYRPSPQHDNCVHEACFTPSREPGGDTTSTGLFYTYYNGEAYYFSPNMNPPALQWLPPPPETPLPSQLSVRRHSQPPGPFSPFTFSQQLERYHRPDESPGLPPQSDAEVFQHALAFLNPKYRSDVLHGINRYR